MQRSFFLEFLVIFVLIATARAHDSDDCLAEYHNAVTNDGNASSFCDRCRNEGGASSLRTRCSLCQSVCPVLEAAQAVGIGEFSMLLGDEKGIRHVIKSGGPAGAAAGFQPSDPQRPQAIFSAGKWTVAAALGAAVVQKEFAWEDPISKYIDWWKCSDAHDNRCKVTFAHCLSHTSGLVADSLVVAALGLNVSHADVGWMNEEVGLEGSVRNIFNNTSPHITVPTPAHRYGQTHYLVAQYAAVQAVKQHGIRTWQEFFEKYWAAPLKLHPERMENTYATTQNYFNSTDAYSYGFFTMKRKESSPVLNPDGGAQMILSPCAYARFLTAYLSKGPQMYGTDTLDRVASFGGGSPTEGNYALGHWILDSMKPVIWHSVGFGGTLPVITTTTRGKRFWVYVSRFEAPADNAFALPFMPKAAPGVDPALSSLVFMLYILPQVRHLMDVESSLDVSTCPVI